MNANDDPQIHALAAEPEELRGLLSQYQSYHRMETAVVKSDLLGAVTAKTVGFDMEIWKDQNSSCLLCNAAMRLDAGAEWPDDPRLLLCWSCMSELCSELLATLTNATVVKSGVMG